MKNKALLVILLSLFIHTVFAQGKLQTGVWRGVLKTSTGNNLPFNFLVSDTAGGQQLAVMNGAERFRVMDVKVVGDSVFIHMPLFDSEFKLRQKSNFFGGQMDKTFGCY